MDARPYIELVVVPRAVPFGFGHLDHASVVVVIGDHRAVVAERLPVGHAMVSYGGDMEQHWVEVELFELEDGRLAVEIEQRVCGAYIEESVPGRLHRLIDRDGSVVARTEPCPERAGRAPVARASSR